MIHDILNYASSYGDLKTIGIAIELLVTLGYKSAADAATILLV
jgi:hypothetical protein